MRNAKRAGFTLVELMVAMALTLFVMVILSQAFVTSLDTFSAMKGIGDMQINLRTASNILKNDLSQDHFEGKRRLSDFAGGSPLIVAQPPQAGFFAVWQGSAPVLAAAASSGTAYVNEGADSNTVPSFRAHDHVLYMTVKRKGNRQENFFTTPLQDTSATGANLGLFFAQATAYDVNATTQLPFYTWAPPYVSGTSSGFYSSQWAEVVYFLVRTGSTEEPNNPASTIGTPTFALYRAQFVMVPDSSKVNTLALASALSQSTFAGMSCSGTANLMFYSPADAAAGNRVIPGLQTFSVANARILDGATLLLPNVLSFHVQIMATGANSFTDVPLTNVPPIPAPPTVPTSTFLYDTALFNVPGNGANAGYTNNFGLQGIQVTLRVFDSASRQSRQMTIVQDL